MTATNTAIMKVLNDSTNKKTNSTNSAKLKKKKLNLELDESGWRSYILAFYNSKKKSQLSFIKDNNLKRKPFRTRWDKSGMKALQTSGTTSADAEKQYDSWFRQWKVGYTESRATNGSTLFQGAFVIHNDNDDDADDDKKNNDNKNDNDGRHDASLSQPISPPSPSSSPTSSPSSTSTSTSTSLPPPPPPPPPVEEEVKTQRSSLLEDEKMRELLVEFYIMEKGAKIGTFIKMKKRQGNKKAIQRHWKESGLESMKIRDEPLAIGMEAYEAWRVSEKEKKSITNKKNGSKEKMIPEEVEAFMKDLVSLLCICGQGIGRTTVQCLFREALSDFGGKDDNGDCEISRSTLERWVDTYEMKCKGVKNIDPARISQVTTENRDAFFFRLDQLIKLLHSIDDDICPWEDWNGVQAEYKYNMDELGTDPTKFTDVLLIPMDMVYRIMQSTPEGDRVNRHVSVAMFSRSDGKYEDKENKIEGAPMPVVIHSVTATRKGKPITSTEEKRSLFYGKQDKIPPVADRFMDGFTDCCEDLGIKVCTSINGSMTK